MVFFNVQLNIMFVKKWPAVQLNPDPSAPNTETETVLGFVELGGITRALGRGFPNHFPNIP